MCTEILQSQRAFNKSVFPQSLWIKTTKELAAIFVYLSKELAVVTSDKNARLTTIFTISSQNKFGRKFE